MRSIITVTTPATLERLTTVARVQAELGIIGSEAEIEVTIDEVSSRIEAELGYHLALETVTETFRPLNRHAFGSAVLLERTPVVAIDSITVDATELAEGEWVVDPVNGLLLSIEAGSGMTAPWTFCNAMSVAYSGGWVMPGEEGRTLPPAIEAAAVAFVGSMWSARQRDPMVRSIDIPGVIRRDYYSPSRAGGEGALLPSGVAMMLEPFKRARV